MALNTSTLTSTSAGSRRRLAGPDVVRAVALIGVVVMNYHGYLIIRGATRGDGWADQLFDPWSGPLSTRFAAAFVLVAGVGVTLLTARTRDNDDRVTEMRWRLVRRGGILYAGGLFLDTIWAGTIIPFYGAMFAISAVLFTLRSRWIALVGGSAIAAGAFLQLWRFWRTEDGIDTAWLFDPPSGSPQGFVFDVFVNGTHPLFPWLGYFCVGILLGRALRTSWWRVAAGAGGVALYLGARLANSTASTDFEHLALATSSGSRGVVYVASALGTALIAYVGIDVAATRFATAVDPLRRAGQMTLTLYLAHILVFNFVVDWMGWVTPSGLATSLTFALGFWVVAIGAANLWHHRLGRGPAERVYRAIGG